MSLRLHLTFHKAHLWCLAAAGALSLPVYSRVAKLKSLDKRMRFMIYSRLAFAQYSADSSLAIKSPPSACH